MSRRQDQGGASLVVALIFLVVLSLLAVAAYKSSSTNLRVVGAMQSRQESLAAAQVALESAISGTKFAENPSGFASDPPVAVDVDNDGKTDYQVTQAKPSCYRYTTIKNSALNPASSSDRSCMVSGAIEASGIDSAVAPAPNDNSLCASTEWELVANVADTRTGTTVAIHQGVAVRVIAADATTYCQ